MQPPVIPDQGQPSFEQVQPSPHNIVLYKSGENARKVSEFGVEKNAGEFLPHELLAYDGSIITTNTGNRYFLKAHNHGSSYRERITQLDTPEGTVSEWVLDGSNDASVVVGEKWGFDMASSEEDEDFVTKVEIDDGLVNPRTFNADGLLHSVHEVSVGHGKEDPFLEAERQAQAMAADIEVPTEPNQTAASETVKAKPERIVYPLNQNKDAFIVSEYAQDGMEVAFANLPEARVVERRILITTKSGEELYIYDDKIFNPKDKTPEGQLRQHAIGDNRMLPTLKIGEKYDLAGISTDEVAKVEIFVAKISRDNVEEFEKFGKSPNAGDRINRFAELEKFLSDTGYIAEYPQKTSRGLFQKPEKPEKTPRIKRNLKLLGRNALLATGYTIQNQYELGKNAASKTSRVATSLRTGSMNIVRGVVEGQKRDMAEIRELRQRQRAERRAHKQVSSTDNNTLTKKKQSTGRGRKIEPAKPVEPRKIT